MRIFKYIYLLVISCLPHLAWGLTIHLYNLPQSQLNENQLQYLQQGVAVFARNLKDNVDLHIGVTMVSFHAYNYPAQFQAGFLANKLPIEQTAVYKLLKQDAKSEADKTALKSLEKYVDSVHFLRQGFTNEHLDINTDTIVDNASTNKNKMRLVPAANIKAIDTNFKFENYGLSNAKFLLENKSGAIILDGIVLLNSAYTFKFSSNTTDNKAYDARALVNHEILGILGLQNAVVVAIEESAMPKCSATTRCFSKKTFESGPLGGIVDLFRYSKKSAQAKVVDWSVTHKPNKESVPYFSIDAGKTPLMYFSFGETNSREQAGLWITPTSLKQIFGDKAQFPFDANQKQFGLNSPLSDASFAGDLSAADLTALDVIGWDVEVKK